MQTDAYQTTGCYNLLCSGFVQTSNRIAIGAAISPRSSYRGGQFDISIMIWKVLHSNLSVKIKLFVARRSYLKKILPSALHNSAAISFKIACGIIRLLLFWTIFSVKLLSWLGDELIDQ